MRGWHADQKCRFEKMEEFYSMLIYAVKFHHGCAFLPKPAHDMYMEIYDKLDELEFYLIDWFKNMRRKNKKRYKKYNNCSFISLALYKDFDILDEFLVSYKKRLVKKVRLNDKNTIDESSKIDS